MPYANKETEREYAKAYREKHKAERAAYAVMYRAKRPDVILAAAARHRVKHRDKIRLRNRESSRVSAGLPAPTRPQPETCECCARKTSRMHLDHDHQTGKFRGWLCGSCNTGIGLLGDTATATRRATAYLETQ